MSTEVKDGKLSIRVEDLLRDETVLATITKYALFDEIVLHGLAEVFVHGQIDWNDGGLPWYICSSSFRANFERARRKLCELAPEGAQKLLDEMSLERNRAVEDRDIYQTRAWRAEGLVRRYEQAIRDAARGDYEDLATLNKAKSQPAHAQKEVIA